jgi:chemotaxis response regulator CheB
VCSADAACACTLKEAIALGGVDQVIPLTKVPAEIMRYAYLRQR